MRGTPGARAALLLLALPLVGCAGRPRADTAAPAVAAAGWRPLIDSAMTGWRGYRQQEVPNAWQVVGGVLTKRVPTRDVVTKDQYGDFELEWEWRVGTGGNGGVFYRASEEYDRVYWSATEYQLLDDPNAPDGRNRLTSAGAAYGLYPAPVGVVKPAGEWNSSRVVARGPRVEHWLNGQKLLEYEQGGADWAAKVKASKFAPYVNYGQARRGHLAIQGDHRGELAIRNMRVRPLS